MYVFMVLKLVHEDIRNMFNSAATTYGVSVSSYYVTRTHAEVRLHIV